MPFEERPPHEVEGRLAQYLADDEKVAFSLTTDIAADGAYGERVFVVTDKALFVTDPLPEEERPVEGDGPPAEEAEAPLKNGLLRIPLSSLTDVKAEALVGSGLLVATAEGRRVELLQYTNSLATEFTKAAKALTDLVKDQKPISLEKLQAGTDRKRCEKCGRVLPNWSDVCPKCVDRRKVLRRITGYGLRYWPYLIAAILLSVIDTVAALIPPQLSKHLVNDVLVPPHKHSDWLLYIVGAMLGVRVLAMFVGMVRGWMMVWLGGKVTFDIRAELYEKMQALTLRFFDKKQVGGLISRMTRDTDYLWHFAVDGIAELTINSLMVLGIGTMLFINDARLAWFVLIPAPVIALMTYAFFKRIRTIYHRMWHRWSRLSATLGEALSGVRVVKAFAQEPREVSRFNRDAAALFSQQVYAERTWVTFYPFIDFSMVIGSLLVWFVGGQLVLKGQSTLGDLTAFQLYLGMFYGPLRFFGHVYSWLQQALTAGERIFEVIDSEPEHYDDPDAVHLPHIKGEVEFKTVDFGYEKHIPVLKNVDLHVKAGEMIGLVGHSGAGKSTMINLICHFYDVDEGELLIDGVDIRKIRLHDLREQIGIVPQESFLFSGTIADNIAYAKPDATREEIIRAARAANAHEFIRKLPSGYDSEVGERGARLSGGERQRIAIARAILHDPRILILDEATASVDTETESQIQQAIARLIKSRTTFAIAHRLSTLRNADRLLVLKAGEVAEVGTHDELMSKDGEYAKLVRMQAEVSKFKVVDG
jgi:ATP-binding cassette subfamily B protein